VFQELIIITFVRTRCCGKKSVQILTLLRNKHLLIWDVEMVCSCTCSPEKV